MTEEANLMKQNDNDVELQSVVLTDLMEGNGGTPCGQKEVEDTASAEWLILLPPSRRVANR